MLPAETRSSRTRIGAARGSARRVAPSARAGHGSGCAPSWSVRRPSAAALPRTTPSNGCSPRRRMWASEFREGESRERRVDSRSSFVEAQVRGALRTRETPRMTKLRRAQRRSSKRRGRSAPLISAAIGTTTTVGHKYGVLRRFFARSVGFGPREVPLFGAFTEALSSELHFHAIPRRPS